jgi:uncharacterized protein with FMN-binding domain
MTLGEARKYVQLAAVLAVFFGAVLVRQLREQPPGAAARESEEPPGVHSSASPTAAPAAPPTAAEATPATPPGSPVAAASATPTAGSVPVETAAAAATATPTLTVETTPESTRTLPPALKYLPTPIPVPTSTPSATPPPVQAATPAATPQPGEPTPAPTATAVVKLVRKKPTYFDNSTFRDGTFTSKLVYTNYGTIQVRVVIKEGRIVDVSVPEVPEATPTSIEISGWSLPVMVAEAIAIEDWNVDRVSGATVTWQGFKKAMVLALRSAEQK